jgi:hemerythrin superfamily protein
VLTVFTLLRQQHVQIGSLLAQLDAVLLDSSPGSGDEAAQQRLMEHLVVASSRHEAAEELVFWPAVRRRLRNGVSLSEHGLAQERDAKSLLDAIRFETTPPALRSQWRELASMVRSHVDYEEHHVWPELRDATGPIARYTMGGELELALKGAPTRPHPRGPDRPIGLATLGVAAAFGDKLRDALSNRNVPPTGDLLPEGPDAADFLQAEHARMDVLLQRIDEQGGRDPDLIARVIKELSIHDSIEREHLYPVLRRRLPNGNDLYPEWLTDHGHVAAVLAEIDRRPTDDPHRQALLHDLVPLVRTHVAQEEGIVFPSMRARMAEHERRAIGRALAEGKDKAPTRPHSRIAGAGFGARMSRLVASPLDRTRDVLSGRS